MFRKNSTFGYEKTNPIKKNQIQKKNTQTRTLS